MIDDNFRLSQLTRCGSSQGAGPPALQPTRWYITMVCMHTYAGGTAASASAHRWRVRQRAQRPWREHAAANCASTPSRLSRLAAHDRCRDCCVTTSCSVGMYVDCAHAGCERAAQLHGAGVWPRACDADGGMRLPRLPPMTCWIGPSFDIGWHSLSSDAQGRADGRWERP